MCLTPKSRLQCATLPCRGPQMGWAVICPLKHPQPGQEPGSFNASTADLRSLSQKGPGCGCCKPASRRDLLLSKQNRHLSPWLRQLESSSVPYIWGFSISSHVHLQKASHSPAHRFATTPLQASATAPPDFCGLCSVSTRRADALSSAWQLRGHCPSLSHSLIHSTNICEHFLCARHWFKWEGRSDRNKLEALTS